jgi:class 3 adenylate cyclase
MRRMAEWLEKLGMSEYAQRFVENRIDFSVLRDLTDQDLKDLGVVLGDRRKLLRAIGELDVSNVAARESAIKSTPHDTAERRQVTVMFSDLVGSTALSARMDRKTCARSFRPIRRASLRHRVASAVSSPITWATGSSFTSAIPKPRKMMPSALCAPDWNRSRP